MSDHRFGDVARVCRLRGLLELLRPDRWTSGERLFLSKEVLGGTCVVEFAAPSRPERRDLLAVELTDKA